MEDDTPKVRVRFVTQDASIRVTDAPLAIPTKLGRQGLAEVINHLLGRGEDPLKLDFLVDDKLLRSTLGKFLSTTGISTEVTVTIEYFRSLPEPSPGPSTAESTDWIGSLTWLGGGVPKQDSVVISGTYGGQLQVSSGKNCQQLQEVHAHEGPIKALRAFLGSSSTSGGVCLTASKDRSVKCWSLGGGVRQVCQMVGHETSVEALAVAPLGHNKVLSGDWSGLMYVWDLKEEDLRVMGGEDDETGGSSKKKRKGGKGETAPATREKAFVGRIKAHAQCVSGIEWDSTNMSHVYTSSWDHSLRIWDLEKQDCLRTLNGSKVVTCLSYSPLAHALASGHSDHRVRVWDPREGATAMIQCTLSGSKAWIADVSWHPTVSHCLASVDHEGLLRLWDIRSPTLALHTLTLYQEHKKGLALCFDSHGNTIYAGGEEGNFKSFTLA